MLTSDYFVKVNMASRKFSGLQFRYDTVRSLLKNFDTPARNVLDSSRILFDAARLMGLTNSQANEGWTFIKLKDIAFLRPQQEDEEAAVLSAEVKTKIEDFSQTLFSDFNSFKKFWLGLQFKNADMYLDAFYQYIPYAKLGVDDEEPVRQFYTENKNTEINPLKLSLIRQKVVIDRLEQVFLKNAPGDLPIRVRESLYSYVVRLDEKAIPMSADL
jgi:hypothetical protein